MKCVSGLVHVLLMTSLVPWSGVLEKLTASQLVKKLIAFYGTLKHVTAVKTAHHFSLS